MDNCYRVVQGRGSKQNHLVHGRGGMVSFEETRDTYENGRWWKNVLWLLVECLGQFMLTSAEWLSLAIVCDKCPRHTAANLSHQSRVALCMRSSSCCTSKAKPRWIDSHRVELPSQFQEIPLAALPGSVYGVGTTVFHFQLPTVFRGKTNSSN